jgi:hypothetical protein
MSFESVSEVEVKYSGEKLELSAAGLTADTLDSGSYAPRAQSAVTLKRFLSKANFIN